MKNTKASNSNRIRWQREKSLERVLPTHAWRWIRTGVVAMPLRPYVKARSEQVAAMMDDLGGPEDVTAMERATLDGWLQSQVVADVLFSRFLRTEDAALVGTLPTYLNTARNHLALLGLQRRQKPTLDLDAYLEARRAENAQENATESVGGTTE